MSYSTPITDDPDHVIISDEFVRVYFTFDIMRGHTTDTRVN